MSGTQGARKTHGPGSSRRAAALAVAAALILGALQAGMPMPASAAVQKATSVTVQRRATSQGGLTAVADKVAMTKAERTKQFKEALAARAAAAAKAAAAKKAAEAPDPHGTWTRVQLRSVLTAAANHYKLTAAQRSWIVDKGEHIVFDGGSGGWGESHGRTQARNGQYLGLFQFGDSWGSASDRLNGVWNTYRFVKVYKDGGQAKIHQHWDATYH